MASFSNIPPELIAHTVSFLQTADTHDVCFGGRTNHLERLRRRADSLCRDRAALAAVCREWREILGQRAEFKAATWTRALFGVAPRQEIQRESMPRDGAACLVLVPARGGEPRRMQAVAPDASLILGRAYGGDSTPPDNFFAACSTEKGPRISRSLVRIETKDNKITVANLAKKDTQRVLLDGVVVKFDAPVPLRETAPLHLGDAIACNGGGDVRAYVVTPTDDKFLLPVDDGFDFEDDDHDKKRGRAGQTHGAERDFALRRRAVQHTPTKTDNYSFPYALVRPGTSWPLLLDVVDIMIPIEMARAARDGDRAALEPLCGVLDLLRSTFPNADIYTTPESIIACLSGGPDPQWVEAPVPYRVVSALTNVIPEDYRGGDFQTLTDVTFTLQAPVYRYVGQGRGGAIYPHGPCWLCQATVNTAAGVDLNSLTTHGDATVTLQFNHSSSDHPSACYVKFHFNEIEVYMRAQIAPFQQVRMAPGALEDGDGPFFCGCRACAADELEFYGLVDLVEKRFLEAGLRGSELEEACDPAWKLVDESGYAEGVRYLRTTYDVPRGRRDPAQPKICSFFPHKDGRARCWVCGSKHK